MSHRTIPTNPEPEVLIEEVLGNLQVKGWDRPEISIKGNSDELDVQQQEETVRISCRSNCVIRLPHHSRLHVEKVHGEASFKLLQEQLTIDEVLGSLSLHGVSDTQVGQVHGELRAKHVLGDLSVDRVLGNAYLRDVQGSCGLEEVSGNLELRDIEGDLSAEAHGNARLRLSTLAGSVYTLSVRGNAHCRFPADSDAQVELNSSGPIQVKLPEGSRTIQDESYTLTLGDGAARVEISAEGNLFFSLTEAGWTEGEESDYDFGEESFASGYQNLADQMEAQIQSQVEQMTRNLNEQMSRLAENMGRAGLSSEQTERIIEQARASGERATARAEEKMRRAQEKLERKLETNRRREEMKAQAAGRRAQSRGKGSWSFSWGSPPPPPPPPAPPPAVSDEERLMILRMLEQKKITVQEAEELLAALEGKET